MPAKEKRPVLDIPMTQTDRFLESVAAFALIVMLIVPAVYWQALPERIATHFDYAGRPDAWGSRISVMILPVVGIVSFFLLTILNRFPHTFNYPVQITEDNAEREYRLGQRVMRSIKAGVTLLFAYLEWAMVQVALGKAQGLSPLLIPILVLAGIALTVYSYMGMYRAK